MVPQPRAGSFSPNPAQSLQTVTGHSPHPSHTGVLSAGASPSTSSPTGTNSLIKIVVAQVYLLLSTIKDDKDRAKWEIQVDQLRKLIDEHGMEVFSKYFTRLVAGNAPQIFPGLNRPVANPGNYHILAAEMRKIALDTRQAGKIAESIESGTEDIFRDFDLSTFMEHFKLDALEKTVLALAFKMSSRSDLKTKADAILSTNFPSFMDIISRPDIEAYADLKPAWVAFIVDRFLQYHPPSFNASSRRDLHNYVVKRYVSMDQPPPAQVLASLDVGRVLADRPANGLARYIQRTGADFSRDEETCLSYLQGRPSSMQLSPDQVSAALIFTTITMSPQHDPSVLTAALQRVLPKSFEWNEVIMFFDQPSARVAPHQFLRLYKALLPIAQDPKLNLDIQRLWGGLWSEPEAQLSFVSAYGSLTSDQLDATTIPRLHRSISMEDYAHAPLSVRERAAIAAKHPLVSVAALSAIFNVALNSVHASQSVEAKRLFQEVVVPNLDIFLVSAFEVPRQSWASMAVDTLNSLFENFLYKRSPEYDFVLDSVWKKDRDWVIQRLIDAHAVKPIDLPLVYDHAVKLGWLDDLVYLPNGFGIDLAAYAHAQGHLDLANWARFNADRSAEMARTLLQFLMIKANLEIQFQRPPDGQPAVKTSTSLQVRTVSALLQILEDFLPGAPVQDLILVQRHCITAYPRLINYGEGYDDVIDANGKDGNALPQAANSKMEEHYKKMYGDELQVRTIVEILDRYKRSREPLDQDAFACMIHGLFDEYNHYVDYPLEALATTAVLFGGIISHKLIAELPLQIGLGMILEAVRDHMPDDPMYKFGLQALMQLLGRFREWPGFCEQLLQIPGLQGTEAYKKAEEIVRDHEKEAARSHNGGGTPRGLSFAGDSFVNGNTDDPVATDRQAPPFAAIGVEAVPAGVDFEEPEDEQQGKIQFVLNNITEGTLQSMRNELRDMLERKHQQWFASHLVEERAKMQPNYHHVYLELVKLFEDNALWNEVLRETFISVARMLNSELTMQNSTERTQLKNLGGWLGLLTLARDKPIKHKNIAFKQLLIEAHDTKRLIVVIPFVCKVLIQGATSQVFRPPNPWLMDIIHLLIELYHHAELKLNLKFEIEVLCKGLNLDHKSIEPSGEILNRPSAEDAAEVLPQDQLDAFENLSLNGIGSVVGSGLSPQAVAPTIPDVSPLITIPPTNEMVVSTTRLHEIVRTALTRALQDIIQPVVDRSITIAAISTVQMTRKDFVSEPDENRLRTSAVNMVKATAGSLALVTSKEPLRANMTNYMRNLSNDLPSGLPEGTIIMCVNSNLELACSIIEKQAEERAVPEIEELLEEDTAARRRHRIQQPNEPFYSGAVNRWGMTIPNPYKLSPNPNGLNPEQMAIYEDFARQPRNVTTSGVSHAPSTSDATRSLANEVLQEPYNTVPALPTPAETPSMQHLGSQLQPYGPVHAAANTMAGGRPASFQMDVRGLADRVNKLLQELMRVSGEAREEHFVGLPRPHPVLDVVDALVQLIIKTSQNSEEFAIYAAEQISNLIFQQVDDNLALESLVHVLETLRKISGPALNNRVRSIYNQQSGNTFLNIPLLAALARTDLVEWRNLDLAMAKVLEGRKDGSLEFLEHMLDLALLNNRPIVLYADFVRTLEVAWAWICEDGSSPAAQRLKTKLMGSTMTQALRTPDVDETAARQDQMEYVFEEWVHLCNNQNASVKATTLFIQQLQARQIIRGRDDFFLFVRVAIDLSVDRFDQMVVQSRIMVETNHFMVDALAKLICMFVTMHSDGSTSRTALLDSVLVLVGLVLNHHHMKRQEHLNQKVFFRLFSMLLHEMHNASDEVTEEEQRQMVLKFAKRFQAIGPLRLPGFAFGWIGLLQHRGFLPPLLQMPGGAGWEACTKLVVQLLSCLGEQLKTFTASAMTRELYRATLKFLIVLQHDFPDFLAASYMKLCASIPPHCAQLLNTVLAASPQQQQQQQQAGKVADSTAKAEDTKTQAGLMEEAASTLRECGLLNVVDQVLQSGPTEDAVAQMAHAMTNKAPKETGFGHVAVAANVEVIGAVVIYMGQHAVGRATSNGMSVGGGEPDVSVLSLLVHEVPAEARYYVLSSMINQLRHPCAQTEYFSQLILYMFGKDLGDPEESEIREEMTRVFLERLAGFWPQPWGLVFTILELIKNDKYMFFDLPFIKSTPEVAERFAALMQRT